MGMSLEEKKAYNREASKKYRAKNKQKIREYNQMRYYRDHEDELKRSRSRWESAKLSPELHDKRKESGRRYLSRKKYGEYHQVHRTLLDVELELREIKAG
jgi:protein subunit release factor B